MCCWKYYDYGYCFRIRDCYYRRANLENQGFVLDELGADKDKETLLLVVAVGYPVDGYEKYLPEKKLTSFVKYC